MIVKCWDCWLYKTGQASAVLLTKSLAILFNQICVVCYWQKKKKKGATGGLQPDKRSTALLLTGEAFVNPPKFKGGSDWAVAQQGSPPLKMQIIPCMPGSVLSGPDDTSRHAMRVGSLDFRFSDLKDTLHRLRECHKSVCLTSPAVVYMFPLNNLIELLYCIHTFTLFPLQLNRDLENKDLP